MYKKKSSSLIFHAFETSLANFKTSEQMTAAALNCLLFKVFHDTLILTLSSKMSRWLLNSCRSQTFSARVEQV